MAQGADEARAWSADRLVCLLNFQREGSEVGVCGGGAEEDCEIAWLDGPLLGGTPALKHLRGDVELDLGALTVLEADAAEGFQLLDRTGHGTIFVTDVELNHIIAVVRAVVGDGHAGFERFGDSDF